MSKYARRIQKVGSSILISLPNQWIKFNHLKKGATLLVEINKDNSISVFPSADANEVAKSVTIPYSHESIDNMINQIYGAYLLGYDIIKIKAKRQISFEHSESIKFALRKLVGLEIVDENTSNIESQFLIDTNSLDAAKILKRMNTIVAGMYRDILDVFVSKNFGIAKLMISRDDEVDRQYFLLVRLIRSTMMDQKLARKLNLSNIDILDYRIAANHLESAGDHMVEFASSLPYLYEMDLHETLKEVCSCLEEMQFKSVTAFINKSSTESIRVAKMYDEFNRLMDVVKKMVSREDQRSSNSNLALLNSIYSLNNLARLWVDVADLVKPAYLIAPLGSV
ncbi:MAG TPA: phosphate uptake regulator PhoU [Nitrososphaeraceae archaeon]|jgi:phosphate uptake regulator